MERLNEKYNLDCFSHSELDSESDEREYYRCEHKYETLINCEEVTVCCVKYIYIFHKDFALKFRIIV